MTKTAIQEQQALKKAIAPAEKKKSDGFMSILKSMERQIKMALPKHLTSERMMRIAQSAYSSNERLQKCDPITIIAGVMQASQLGLEINTSLGQSYLIPRTNKRAGRMEAQFQIGYQGELSLAYRSGQYKMISAYDVYENDEFEYELGLSPFIKHKPAKAPKGDPIYYYAVYKTVSGGEGFAVMSREQIIDFAKVHSESFSSNYSPWSKHFNAMAKKTVLRQALKYGPKSIEYERQFFQDETVKREISTDMSAVMDSFDWEGMDSANEDKDTPKLSG